MSNKFWPRIPLENGADRTSAEIDDCAPHLFASGVGIVAAEAGIGKTLVLSH